MRFLTVSLLGIFGLSSGQQHSTLKDWYTEISDIGRNCPNQKWDRAEQFISIVSCDDPDARLDYSFKLAGGRKFSPKRGQHLAGKGRLSFVAMHRREPGTHNMGIRTGICFKLTPNPALVTSSVVAIKADFENSLPKKGDMTVSFADESTWTMTTDGNGKVGGVIKAFDAAGLANVTREDGSLALFRDKFGYFHFIFDNDDSSSSNNAFITSDFNELLNCQRRDSKHLARCRVVDDVGLDIRGCHVAIKPVEEDPDDSGRFYLNLWSRETVHDGTDIFQFCPKHEESSGSKDIRQRLKEWINLMANAKRDPFWMVEPTKEPLDPSDPRIDITLKDYEGRDKLANMTLRIHSSDRTLFKGTFSNGRLQGEVDKTVASYSDWQAPLTISQDKIFPEATSWFTTEPQHEESGGDVADQDGVFAIGRLELGQLNGPVRIFARVSSDPSGPCANKILERSLSFVGYFKAGVPTGYCWRGLAGSAWLVGQVDEHGEFTGSDVAYVYQDLKTAIVGEFKKGLLVRGRAADVIGERCHEGIKILEFSEPYGPELHYDPMTSDSLGDQPTVGDPLDNRYVHLKVSEIFPEAGEGSVAKVDIPKDTTYVLYGGFLVKEMKKSDETEGMSADESEELTKYRYHFKSCQRTLDLPPQYGDTKIYRSTLAHKTNNVFVNPNVAFSHIESARFGTIPALRTMHDVKKGEEFLLYYGYGVGGGPSWYRNQYKQLIKDHPEYEGKAPPFFTGDEVQGLEKTPEESVP